MTGLELCPKCKGLHFKTAPCIIRKTNNPVSVSKAMKVNTVTTVAPEPEQVVQLHRPEPSSKRPVGRPKTITDMKAYKAKWAREYRARKASKSNPNTPERNDE